MNTAKRRWAAGLAEPERTLVVNTVMLNATYTALEATSACRERCGAQGLLLHNRISAYVGLAHGAVTAEGDNQVVALALARQLMERDPRPVGTPEGPGPSDAGPGPLRAEAAPSPEGIGALLDGRTEALLAQARAVVGAPGHASRFDAWNAAAPTARDAALAHCEAEAYRSLLDVPAPASGPARAAWQSLTLHHGLTLLARHGAWHLAEGRLDPGLWRALHARIERCESELAAHGTALVDAFGYGDDLLQVPIARTGDTSRPQDPARHLAAPASGVAAPAASSAAATHPVVHGPAAHQVAHKGE
jgi:acyl-CoA oxidase